MKWFRFHLGDWATGTAHLGNAACGVYLHLLTYLYARQEPLPGEFERLKVIVKTRTRHDVAALEKVLGEFFVLTSAGYLHARAAAEMRAAGVTGAVVGEGLGDVFKRDERDVTGSVTVTGEVSHVTPSSVTVTSRFKTRGALRASRYRARRKELLRALDNVGIRPSVGASIEELQTLLGKRDGAASSSVTSNAYAGGRARNTQEPREYEFTARAVNSARAGDGEMGGNGAPSDGPRASPAGDACRAMRAAGIPDVNPSHPDLLALLAAGAEVHELAFAAREAVERGKGFAYALAVVRGRRADAAARGPLTQAKADAAAERAAEWSSLLGSRS